MPFWFPGNVLEWLNGTKVSKSYTVTINDENLIVGVSEVIPEDKYNKMLKEKQFNHYAQQDFHGYNDPRFPFPFWSSEAFTYSAALLAMISCKYKPSLDNTEQLYCSV